MRKFKLFCFPYAGGSAVVYHRWRALLPEYIELIPIELSGRGTRYQEPLLSTMNEIVDDAFATVAREINKSKFAFFGHCMGAVIIYELYYKLLKEVNEKPAHLFFSGANPPTLGTTELTHNLPEEEFLGRLFELGGMPQELMQNRELLDLYLPILRADFKAVETYVPSTDRERIQSDISIVSGRCDKSVLLGEIQHWADLTSGKCSFYRIPGGHFYLNANRRDLTSLVHQQLLQNTGEEEDEHVY